MAKYMTSNTLIESVKRRAMIPTNQSTFAESDFLEFANEELELGLVPSILQFHEEYLSVDVDIPIVDNTSRYKIPSRATGNKLRELAYIDNSGNTFEMTRIKKDDLNDFDGPYSGGLRNFYIQNNEVVLFPDVGDNAVGTLRMTFYIRPNELVAESRIATITNIDTVTGVITVNGVPSNFNSTLKDDDKIKPQTYDIIESDSPFVHLAYDLTPVAVNSASNTVSFTAADLPNDIQVGDMLTLACETKVPQVPADLHVVLAHRVAARCLEAMGDTQGLSNANQKLQEFEVKTGTLVDNRVEGAPMKIRNGNGILRQGLMSRRYRRGK